MEPKKKKSTKFLKVPFFTKSKTLYILVIITINNKLIEDFYEC